MDKTPESLWSLKKKESGKIYAKLPLATLKTWILEARIDPEDLVANPQTKEWVSAGDVTELAPFFAPETMGAEVIANDDISFPWQSSKDEELSFDLTPMIDVTFLLLTFFLANATFAIHQVKNIEIPKATHTQEFKQEKLAILITKERNIYLGQAETSLANLNKRLREEVAKTQQQDIVVSADHSLDYGFIIAVLDEINGAGIKSVKLKLEKKKKNE